MMDDCLFCKIVAGEIPCDKVEENDLFLAFRDIDPQAPTHILVIPKTHVRSLAEADDSEMLGGIMTFAREIAASQGLTPDGYRVVINTNVQGGQMVFHLHVHVLGGRPMKWPPG
jgi:histidine triad (HIT) family protein